MLNEISQTTLMMRSVFLIFPIDKCDDQGCLQAKHVELQEVEDF